MSQFNPRSPGIFCIIIFDFANVCEFILNISQLLPHGHTMPYFPMVTHNNKDAKNDTYAATGVPSLNVYNDPYARILGALVYILGRI
jgi:hypothetical protein